MTSVMAAPLLSGKRKECGNGIEMPSPLANGIPSFLPLITVHPLILTATRYATTTPSVRSGHDVASRQNFLSISRGDRRIDENLSREMCSLLSLPMFVVLYRYFPSPHVFFLLLLQVVDYCCHNAMINPILLD